MLTLILILPTEILMEYLIRTTKPVIGTRLHLKILADTNTLQRRSPVMPGCHLKLCRACTDSRRESTQHRNDTDNLYTEVCHALHRASELTISTNWCNEAGEYIIPDWNEYIREAHIEARHAYIARRDIGKPRPGSVCGLTKVTLLRFKYTSMEFQVMEETALSHIFITQRHDGFPEVY